MNNSTSPDQDETALTKTHLSFLNLHIHNQLYQPTKNLEKEGNNLPRLEASVRRVSSLLLLLSERCDKSLTQ